VLNELCEQLQHREQLDVRIVARPDREERRKQAPDAIMLRGAQRWAVEHTRVFVRPNLLEHHARLDVVRPIIERRITSAFPRDWVVIALPLKELLPGQDWQRVADLISDAAIARLPELDEGTGWRLDVSGFRVRPIAEIKRRAAEEGHCWVMSLTTEEDDELGPEDMRRAMESKKKVEELRDAGCRTMLVLDSAELLVETDLYVAFERAATPELVRPYDEIFLAMSGWEPALFVMLKSDDRWPVGQPQYAEFIDLWSWARNRRQAQGLPVR
jgi:hypothetical protein